MAEDMKKGGFCRLLGCFSVCCCCRSGHGGNGEAFSLEDARPYGVGLLRGDGIAQRLEARDSCLCIGGVAIYSFKYSVICFGVLKFSTSAFFVMNNISPVSGDLTQYPFSKFLMIKYLFPPVVISTELFL